MKRLLHSNSFIVLFCMCLTAFFGLLFLGNKNFALDELATMYIIKNWSSLLYFTHYIEANMWLYYLLVYFWSYLGHSEFVIRLLSVFFAIASIPVVFLLGRKMFDAKIASITTLLLSINVFFIFNAQNARSYSLLLFLITLSSLCFITCISSFEKDEKHMKRNLLLIGFTVCNILAVYAHFYALFVIASQYVSLLFIPRKKMWFHLLSTMPIIAAGILPLFLSPAVHNQPTNWIPKPGLRNLIGTFIVLSNDFLPIGALYILQFIYFSIMVIKKHSYVNSLLHNWKFGFLLTWILFPIIASFLFSTFFKPLYISSYFFICLVPFTMFAAICLQTIKKSWLQYSALACIVLLSLVRLFGWYSGSTALQLVIQNQNEDWQKAAILLATQVKSSDPVLFFPPYLEENINYYYQQHTSIRIHEINLQPDVVTGGSVTTPFDYTLLATIPEKYPHLWYVTGEFTDAQRNKQKLSVESLLKNNYRIKSEKNFEKISVMELQRIK